MIVYGDSFCKSNRDALKKLKARMDPRAFALALRQAEEDARADDLEREAYLAEVEACETDREV